MFFFLSFVIVYFLARHISRYRIYMALDASRRNMRWAGDSNTNILLCQKKTIKVNINIQSSLSDRTAHTPTRVYIFQFHLIPFTRTHVSHYSGWAGGVRGDTKIAFVNIYIHSFEEKSTRHTTNYNVKDLNYAQLVVVFGLNIYFSLAKPQWDLISAQPLRVYANAKKLHTVTHTSTACGYEFAGAVGCW